MAAPPAVLSPAARLPVELVAMICNELAVLGQSVWHAGSSTWHLCDQQRALAAAARICRRWAGPAQAALLRSLYFSKPDDCADFLAAMEHNPHLLDIPRLLSFEVDGARLQAAEPHLGMRDFIPILFVKCPNVEFVYVSAVPDMVSPAFEDAFCSMRHLRTFIFESKTRSAESGARFQRSMQRAPVSLRTLAVYHGVDIGILFELPGSLETIDYNYMGDDPLLILSDFSDLLDHDARPIKTSTFSVWVESDFDFDRQPSMPISDDVVEALKAKFAARGVVFKLHRELDWIGP
ncbi:hypothetical protein JCM8208_006092 [Rhodotorula glutinis]